MSCEFQKECLKYLKLCSDLTTYSLWSKVRNFKKRKFLKMKNEIHFMQRQWVVFIHLFCNVSAANIFPSRKADCSVTCSILSTVKINISLLFSSSISFAVAEILHHRTPVQLFLQAFRCCLHVTAFLLLPSLSLFLHPYSHTLHSFPEITL